MPKRLPLILLATLLVAGCERPPSAPPAERATDQDTLRRLLGILDYVAADYRGAVTDGKVTDQAEFAEQVAFMHDAEELAAKVPARPGVPSAHSRVAPLGQHVNAIAAADAVASEARAIRSALIADYQVVLAPTSPPTLARGKELYTTSCVSCHGVRGDADTEAARRLEPPPRSFIDPDVMVDLSPARAYNALTDGVRGTAMASFGVLPASDRWSLAFYVFTLRHAGADAAAVRTGEAAWQRAGRQPAASATRLAGLSDGDLERALAALPAAERAAAVGFLRTEAPFRDDHAGAPMAQTRTLLGQAMVALRSGDRAAARRQVGAAYLEGFEPHEASLRARDAALVSTIEDSFLGLRSRAGDATVSPARVESEALRVHALLDRAEERLAGGRTFSVGFWAAFVVLLREGIEAALLLTLLLGAVRRRSAAPDDPGVRVAVRWIHVGWLLALGAGVATWLASGSLIELGGARRELTEGIIALVAAVAMFSASHWILARLDAKRRVEALKNKLADSARRGWVLPALAFLVVYREVFEVVLFLRAIMLDGGGQAAPVALGAGVAAIALVGFVLAMGHFGKRLKPAPLLAIAGVMLCLLAIVFAGKGVRALQEAGVVSITPMLAPRLDWLGMFPTVQTVAAQALFGLLLLASTAWWLRGRLGRRGAAAEAPAVGDGPA